MCVLLGFCYCLFLKREGEEKTMKLDREMGKIWEELRKEIMIKIHRMNFLKIKVIE